MYSWGCECESVSSKMNGIIYREKDCEIVFLISKLISTKHFCLCKYCIYRYLFVDIVVVHIMIIGIKIGSWY